MAGIFDEKLWPRIDKSGGLGVCWPWTGSYTSSGYGDVTIGGVRRLAHRMAWLDTYGPIPDGMDVLHHCDNPPCCNPFKCLFLGTQRDNNLDRDAKGRTQRYNADKTHCIHGHEFTPENTHTTKAGVRQCRTCHRTRQGIYNKRTRHAVPAQ